MLRIKRRKTLGLQSNSIKVPWRHFQRRSSSRSPWNHPENIYLVGGWTDPIWTILVSQIGSCVQFLGVKSKHMIEVSPPMCETPCQISTTFSNTPPHNASRYQRSKHPVMVQDQQDTLAPAGSRLPYAPNKSLLLNFGLRYGCHLAKSRFFTAGFQDSRCPKKFLVDMAKYLHSNGLCFVLQ